MADDNPYIIPEMDPTLRKQIQECNMQIVNVTTPANFFHVLRRQVGTINGFDVGFLINVPYFLSLSSCFCFCRYIENSENLSL
jgi:hypothetical protein